MEKTFRECVAGAAFEIWSWVCLLCNPGSRPRVGGMRLVNSWAVAGFGLSNLARSADWEVGDTAGWEICGTPGGSVSDCRELRNQHD